MIGQTEQKRVLVVDDDHDFVRTLELYLRYAGYDVSCAYGGLGALEEMRVVNPHAIILDVLMPDIDGRKVVRHIREKLMDHDTAVIVVTALSDQNSRIELMTGGANEFLTKPCDPEEVCRAVEHSTSPQADPLPDSFFE